MLTESDKAAYWTRFKQLVEAIGYGHLQEVEIRDGVPISVALAVAEIDLTRERAPARRAAIINIDNSRKK